MKITKGEIAVFAIALAAFIVGTCFYPYLPERMASHWNARGEVDDYMSKAWGAFLMPVVIAGIGLLFMVIIRIDPLKANIAKFRKYYDGFIILLSVFMLCLHVWMLLWNVGYKFSAKVIIIVLTIGVGLLIFYTGILCENAKRNWFIGIRTPWTLSSDIVWDKTHKIGAKLFKAMGIVILAGVFWPDYLLWFILIPTILITVFLLVYSYVVYQKVGEISKSTGRLNNESGNGTWETVKAGYLEQVQKALASAGHLEKKQVLEDVQSHLDQRFNELGPDEQTWENFQQIITEMGPAQDYAELLAEDSPRTPTHTLRKIMVTVVVLVAVAATVLLLLRQTPGLTDISVDRLKLRPYSEGGLHYLVASIRNNGPNPTDKFEVHFYLGDPESSEAKVHGAGPIQPGDVWNEASMPFKIDPDSGEFTVKITPQNDNNPQNNSASISIQQEKPGLDKSLMNQGRIVDNIDLPFADDPEVVGKWTSVDFVDSIDEFNPAVKRWAGDLFLHELAFHENGRLIAKNEKVKRGYTLKWTKGIIISSHEKTASKYHIKEIDDEKYMFYEWKSGDYTVRHRKPSYYVLKKLTSQIPQIEPTPGVYSAIQWLELIDNGNYGASWEEAAEVFKNAVSKQQWAGMAKTVRQPLGKVISRQVTSKMPTQTVPGGPDGEYVIIQFRTSFENKKDAIETVTPMLDKDGAWRVSGYYIK